MVSSEKSIYWNTEKGSIHLVQGGTEQRLFMMRKGFMDSFFDEILSVEGKDALSMTVRMILERVKAAPDQAARYTLDALNRYKDDCLLPLSVGPEGLPAFFARCDGTREFIGFGSVMYLLETVSILNIFKEVSAQILTPRGARAIIRTVGKRAGMAIGDAAKANYSWNDLDDAMSILDRQLRVIFPLLGWGFVSVASKKLADGNYLMLVRCHNTFESDSVSSTEPVCSILSSLFEGISESIASTLTGNAAECREVRCASMGEDHCTFAVMEKAKGSPMTDWAALENEWRALDT